MIHGLRFYRASVKRVKGASAPIFVHGRLEERRSDFDFIFSCLYPQLENLVFPDDLGEPFVAYVEEHIKQSLESFEFDGREFELVSARLLPVLGEHVSDDWNSALLFRAGEIDAPQMQKLADKLFFKDDRKVLTDNDAAQVLFHNWDGVYWEIYCKDAALIERLLQTHRGNERLAIYKVEFALDYPDPRKVMLEKA